LELSKADLNLYFEIKDEINSLGFDTSEFGHNAIIINGLPSELSKNDGADVILQIIEDFRRTLQALKISKTEALRQATARHAAIKAGVSLTHLEMKTLVQDLMQCKQQTHTSSGLTIIVKLTKSSLERFFQ
jgi:DNA mismatch repair protein MutL